MCQMRAWPPSPSCKDTQQSSDTQSPATQQFGNSAEAQFQTLNKFHQGIPCQRASQLTAAMSDKAKMSCSRDSQETQVLLWDLSIPKLHHVLVWALWVGPLSTHQHPHLDLGVTDDLQTDQPARAGGSSSDMLTKFSKCTYTANHSTQRTLSMPAGMRQHKMQSPCATAYAT